MVVGQPSHLVMGRMVKISGLALTEPACGGTSRRNSDREVITTLRGHDVGFSPDGKTLALRRGLHTIQIWKTADLYHLDLDGLLVGGCEWLHGYLKNNPMSATKTVRCVMIL